ncbi:MAG: Ku protein [Candidatus Dependentiae bacterium]|nr:Ku protein [Candidatus Dependentiae bacterium]
MKAIWSGSLSFGLVNITVNLYSAIAPRTPGFKLLCSKCHTPIVYERWCRHCHKEVSWHDTVKGLQQSDGSYFILTQESLKSLKPERSDAITITEFVTRDQLQTIYFDDHYYLGPSKKNEKEFFLFQEAINSSDKVAIGDFVMHDKEHVCAITPYKNGLLLSTLNYAYEIKDINAIVELEKKPTLGDKELKLAQQIIHQLSEKKFDLKKYKDTFAQRLEKAIKESKKIKPKTTKRKEKKITPHEKTLLAMLKASLHKPSKYKAPVAIAKSRHSKAK